MRISCSKPVASWAVLVALCGCGESQIEPVVDAGEPRILPPFIDPDQGLPAPAPAPPGPPPPTVPPESPAPCPVEQQQIWFADRDADGVGGGAGQVACTPPDATWVAQDGDCDDGDPTRHPGASELCDGKDNDCDDAIDEDLGQTYYPDRDGDGFGAAGPAVVACSPPPGHVENAEDCYDDNAQARPGQKDFFTAHRGDGSFDYDCDGRSAPRWGAVHQCKVTITSGTLTLGWRNAVPQCGVVDDYTTGKGSWTWLGCNLEWRRMQQACR